MDSHRTPVAVISARLVLALLLLNLAACASMHTVNIENAMRHSPPHGVDHGSLVEVRTLDRKTVKFRVTEINDAGLGGKMGFYAYEDMQSLKVESHSSSDTDPMAVVLGILGVAALVWLVGNADSVAVCSPSPCPTPNP